MPNFIKRVWDQFLHLLYKRTILILTVLFCIGVGVAMANMSRLSSHLISSQALQNASLFADAMQEARTLYSSQAVARVNEIPGISVTHNYKNQTGAIPLPATFLLELGHTISKKNSGMSAHLYSDYPFPWRQQEGGPRDSFQQDALRYLKKFPNRSFYRTEKIGNNQMFRYAQADLMKATCVACHNSHPDSPKTDWKVGDVRGILEISQPLGSFIADTQRGLSGTFLMLGGLSGLALFGLTLILGRLRQTAKELEQRVRDRTADLAIANGNLEKRNKLIQQVFGRYLSDKVVANLLDTPEALKLGGARRQITIMTSDLRGFTALSERLPPEQVVEILNFYLKQMADIITEYEGTIDEFMGDGILVLFGAPTPRSDDSTRAVACALAMQLAMKEVNEKMTEWNLSPLEMGIGINTGEVVLGNIGSEKRTKYGVVGSQVNLTYRIESYTMGSQVLISSSTLRSITVPLRITHQKQVKPKGVKEPITIYEIGGIGGDYNLYLTPEEEIFMRLTDCIPIQYTILEGKHIGDVSLYGELVRLSAKGAEIRPKEGNENVMPHPMSNIKLNLVLFPDNPLKMSEDVYAKVLDNSAGPGSFSIRFTAKPPEVTEKLDSLYQALKTT